MRPVLLWLIIAIPACSQPPQQPALLSFDLREVAGEAAPRSLAQGITVSGDHSEGDSPSLASYTGELSLTATEFPGFADRFCVELERFLEDRTGVSGSNRRGEGTRTLERDGGTPTTTVEASHHCAYRVELGWVVAHVVLVDVLQRAFMHVSIMRS